MKRKNIPVGSVQLIVNLGIDLSKEGSFHRHVQISIGDIETRGVDGAILKVLNELRDMAVKELIESE